MNNKMHARKGFTLVEIMIVVVIIGLLAAMAIPAFSKVRAASRTSAVTNNLRQLFSAAQQYMLDKSSVSCSESDLVGSTTDYQLHVLTPVAGENYTTLTVGQTTTQISISSAALGTVSYSQ
jgi:prepilin-type N-terminal cleavage/methylation domain-containing protein